MNSSRIDGWVLLEINLEGKMRLKEFGTHDARLEEYMVAEVGLEYFYFDEGFTEVTELKNLKDCLVMVFWNYECVKHGYGDWDSEYEDVFKYVTHVVIQNNYKAFYREQVQNILTVLSELQNEDEYSDVINSWESFYNEKFFYKKGEK